MAFFGLTHLGSQNPIGDKMIVNVQRQSRGQDGFNNIPSDQLPPGQEQLSSSDCSERTKGHSQQLPYSTNIHQGSHQKYKEMVKQTKLPRAPNQLYVMPVTDSQQYGWLSSGTPEPWTRVQRFPRKNSEMTKFINDVSMIDQEFSLF